jgi:hypothetical protein
VENPTDLTNRQDQVVALAWVRGQIELTEVARAFGLPETSMNEISRRLSRAINAYIQQPR